MGCGPGQSDSRIHALTHYAFLKKRKTEDVQNTSSVERIEGRPTRPPATIPLWGCGPASGTGRGKLQEDYRDRHGTQHERRNAKLLSLLPVLCPRPWPSMIYPQITFTSSLALIHVHSWDSPCTSHGRSLLRPFLHPCLLKYPPVFKAATNDDPSWFLQPEVITPSLETPVCHFPLSNLPTRRYTSCRHCKTMANSYLYHPV